MQISIKRISLADLVQVKNIIAENELKRFKNRLEDNLINKKMGWGVFKDRFLSRRFHMLEQQIIDKYLKRLQISDAAIMPMLIMFWMNSITQRHKQVLNSKESMKKQLWKVCNIYSIIDKILTG